MRLLTLLALALAAAACVSADPIPESFRQNGWFVGSQAYTFKSFSFFEAIAKTKEAGGNVIELFPGQAVKPGSKEKTHHSMSDATMAEIKAELDRQGVRAVNYGVVGAKDKDEVYAIMKFAKKMGLYSVCTESTEQIAAWEAAAIEFDMKVAFHEHGSRIAKDGKIDTKYKVWNPLYVLGVVESRDHRVGACADIGHWATSDLSSVWCLKVLEGRIISVHLKDKSDFGHKAGVVVAGKGVVDVDGCLKELIRQKFDGHISVEHEADWENSVPQVKADIDFVKAHAK
ncbi:MAG: sugar phosphate isomerase/epimerase [Verrucomicrobia bacterium]|nr:sugar phosphate isomerase/epimerase [Verrucomicrobiota bacterium]